MTAKLTLLVLPAAVAGMILWGPWASPAAGQSDETMSFDVAIDGTTYVQNDVDPAEGQAVFTRGDTGIVDGTLYPPGTIPPGNAGNDPNAPGGIGKMRCRLAYIIDTAQFLAGAPIVTYVSELYSLPDDRTLLMADGPGPNMGVTMKRIVFGGTGRFAGAVGELIESNIGINKTGFCNLRVTLKIKKAGD